MPDPEWPSSPPEVNYLRLAGAGAAGTATTLANAAAWQALMGSNEAAFSLSALNTATTAADFQGVGGLSSAAAATGLNAALQLLAGWTQEKPPIAAQAVAAYETALSSMIPAEVCLANRAEQAADVAMNPLVLGALTPAIVALDAEYFGEHWPHNAVAGATYGAALTALVAALAIPPPPSPPGASPAGPVAAAGALAEDVGQIAAEEAAAQSGQILDGLGDAAGEGVAVPAAAAGQIGQMGSMLAQPLQAAMGAMGPLAGMFGTPLQSLGSLAGLLPSLNAASGGRSTGGEADEFDDIGTGLGLEGAGEEDFPGGALIGVPEPGGLGAGIATGGAAGSGASAASGPPGAGITSYTRPHSAFEASASGRPVGLKPGLLSATAELQSPTAGGGMVTSPAPGGLGKNDAEQKSAVAQARIVADGPGSPQG